LFLWGFDGMVAEYQATGAEVAIQIADGFSYIPAQYW